jgi:predicted secreted protein
MTATPGYKGFGTTVTFNSAVIGYTRDKPFPSESVDEIDLTNSDSESEWEESIPGMKHGGDLSFDMIFVPGDAGQIALRAAKAAGTVATLLLTAPAAAGVTISMSAWVKDIGGAFPYKGEIVQNVTFKITGPVTYSATASTGLETPFFAISESAVIAPAPAGAVYDYVATVLTGVTSVTVTPTASAGVITVNGNVVATGEASSAITLGAAGSVTVVTVVVKETGKTAKTYIIRVTRAA